MMSLGKRRSVGGVKKKYKSRVGDKETYRNFTLYQPDTYSLSLPPKPSQGTGQRKGLWVNFENEEESKNSCFSVVIGTNFIIIGSEAE